MEYVKKLNCPPPQMWSLNLQYSQNDQHQNHLAAKITAQFYLDLMHKLTMNQSQGKLNHQLDNTRKLNMRRMVALVLLTWMR
jgi:hypothetical protein